MTRKKAARDTEFSNEGLPDRLKDVNARIAVHMEEAKTARRDRLAGNIIIGICAGDWKFDLSDGKTWDEVAVARAYEIADAMLKEREISNV
jgi:hypothetical protein